MGKREGSIIGRKVIKYEKRKLMTNYEQTKVNTIIFEKVTDFLSILLSFSC